MKQRTPLIVFALVMAAIPFIPGMPPFWIVLLNNIGLAALVAMGLVLLTGVGGLTSFGQAAFCGFGAYTTAVLTTAYGFSPWLTLPLSLLVSGGTGSGKTTLLSALLAAVPASERLVTVEDAEELRPPHPHVVRLVARQANVEGAGTISLRDLVRQALRMRPDRIVVGEVRGAEVVDLLAALNTGHEGGAGTVHANTAADVPARLEALAGLGGIGREALHSQLAGAVRIVLHVRRVGRQRVLQEIAVLERGPDGLVVSVPAVVDGRCHPAGAPLLARLLTEHGQATPW